VTGFGLAGIPRTRARLPEPFGLCIGTPLSAIGCCHEPVQHPHNRMGIVPAEGARRVPDHVSCNAALSTPDPKKGVQDPARSLRITMTATAPSPVSAISAPQPEDFVGAGAFGDADADSGGLWRRMETVPYAAFSRWSLS